MNAQNIRIARQRYKASNLRFIVGKAPDDLPNETFDVVILSNVLEHQEDRIGFIRRVIDKIHPGRFLIRVPCYERDWKVPLKEEMGVDYFTDPTHYVEYKVSEFEHEMKNAGLTITSLITKWGEIYAVCKVMV